MEKTLPKLDKGKPLSEAKELLEMVRGSYDYLLNMLHRAFYSQFNYEITNRDFWIVETFQDYLIVREYGAKMPPDEFLQVIYRYDETSGAFVFAPIEEWTRVLLAYVAPSFEEQRKGLTSDKGKKFSELFFETVRLEEAVQGKPRKVTAVGAYADQVNANGRRYRANVMREAVREARQHLSESLSQGRAVLLGEAEHPSDKGQRPRFLETIVVWKDLSYDERTGEVHLEGEMVETSQGKDAIAVMSAGVLPGISLRGYGESKIVKEGERQVEEVQWLKLTGFDMVLEPSFGAAGVTKLESRGSQIMPIEEKDKQNGGNPTAAAPSAEVLYQNHPDVVKKIMLMAEADQKAAKEAEAQEQQRKLTEMRQLKAGEEKALREALGVDETADLTAVIAEREADRQRLEKEARIRTVREYVEAQTKPETLNYPPNLAAKLREQVLNRKPETVEEAKTLLTEMRSISDMTVAEIRLGLKGKGITVGSVLEQDAGVPEFARAAFEITEALVKSQHVPMRNRRKEPTAPADFLIIKLLERYDAKHRQALLEESRRFQEAELLSDLSLPYSVGRAIMQEAYPLLIAANAFDFGVADGSPTTIYYQANYAGESGTSGVAVTNEVVNQAAMDSWESLANKSIRRSGINLTNTAGTTTYTYGTDYVIDFREGKILFITGGALSTATDYHLDYTYDAIRKGENSAIAKAKATLSSTTLTQNADRLATEVSREAVVFSRSQLGWDAALQTVSLLIREIAKRIDAGILATAESLAYTSGNNSGAWNSSTDSLQTFVEKLNNAKTAVQNDLYDPTAFIMSTTHANRLALYDKFTAAGQTAGFNLVGQTGYLGDILGLPVFHSTQFSDSTAICVNRELIQHRVFQPMLLKGPFPSYDGDGNIKANEQWFVEEFNGMVYPIAQKSAYVTIS